MATSDPHHQFTALIQELLDKCEEFKMVYQKPADGAADDAEIECSLNFTLSDGAEAPRMVDGAPGDAAVGGAVGFEAEPATAADGSGNTGQHSDGTEPDGRQNPASFGCPNRDCNREFETKHGRRIHYSKAHQPATFQAQSAPADAALYKNPEVLRKIYDEDESFAEMAAKLEADVSASTVRRHMINFGIHEPTSYDTTERAGNASADARDARDEEEDDDGTRQLDTALERMLDELGIDPSLSVEEVTDAILESETLHETSNRLDLDQEQTRDLLLRMDVLDAVFGRLNDKERHDVPTEEVETRIRESLSQAPAT